VEVITTSTTSKASPAGPQKLAGGNLKGSAKKHALDTFSTAMNSDGVGVAFGVPEVSHCVKYGAVAVLFLSSRPTKGSVAAKLAVQTKAQGGAVEVLRPMVDGAHYRLVDDMTGVCALLRFQVDEEQSDFEDDPDFYAVPEAVASDVDTDSDGSDTESESTSAAPSPAPPAPHYEVAEVDAWTIDAHIATAIAATSDATVATVATVTEEAAEELEAMAMIYPAGEEEDPESEVQFRTVVGDTATCLVAVRSASALSTACLRVMLPKSYPEQAAEVLLEHSVLLDATVANAIIASSTAICADNVGDAVLYLLVENLSDLLN